MVTSSILLQLHLIPFILNVIHHAGVQLETCTFRSCLILSLFADVGVLPLDLHQQSLVASFWHRVQCLLALSFVSPCRTSPLIMFSPPVLECSAFQLSGCLNNALSSSTITVSWPPFVVPWEHLTVHFFHLLLTRKLDVPGHITKLFFLNHTSQYEGYTRVFTDSSESDIGISIALVL